MIRHAIQTMGTVASLALDRDVGPDVLERVARGFAETERTFSLYRADSVLSALARGDLDLAQAPARVLDEYGRALEWRQRTAGWFTPHRPDGVIDLSGTVKAVAIEAARELLEASGAEGLLGIGGDIVVLGHRPQHVGVVDPLDRGRLAADPVLVRGQAIATSGSSERGAHIWTRLGTTDVLQATVIAGDIVTADVLATALVAAGSENLDALLGQFDVDALVFTATRVLATPGWPRSGASERGAA